MSRLFEAALVLGLQLMIFIIQSEAFNRKSTVRCNKVADIVFVLDSSTSIWKSDFEKQLNFVKYFVKNLNIGLEANQVRIGALSFSDKVEIDFYLNESTDKSNILQKVSRIRQLTGSTYTWMALRELINMFKPGNGARPNVTHIAIILTDGNSQKPRDTLEAANMIHRQTSIKVFALAIGEYISVEEIRGIASHPKDIYFKHTASFSELEHIKESFFDRTCWEISSSPRLDEFIQPSTEAPSTHCKEPADIVFILDSSTSIARQDFKKQLNFVKYFVENLNIGLSSKEVRIGALSFSDKVEINFYLNESTDRSNVLRKVSRIQQLTGSTYTWMALRELINMFKPGNGARSSVTQVAIVLTDGNSQKPNHTLEAANMIHRQTSIKVFALAIGENIAADEIRGIASSPKWKYFKQTASYTTLESIKETVFNTTCEVIYRTTTTAITPVICTNPADIVFVLDSSTSISKADFEKQLEFVKYFVRNLNVGQSGNQVRIGVLSFSDKVEIDFYLNESTDESSILQKVSRIRQLTGSTYTWLALRELINMFKHRNGARPFVKHVSIILTDGNSQNPLATSKAARAVHEANIKVFALAIGEYIRVEEIRDIASFPKDTFFKKTASFSELERIKESFLTTTCKVVNERSTLPPIRISTTEGVCGTMSPIEIVFLVNNVHFGQKRTEKILRAINHVERKIHHTCVSHFRTIFEDCSTFEDTFDTYNPRNRNHKFNNCRIGIFFVQRGMNFQSPILQNITRNLLKDTTEIFAVMIGDIKEVSGLRYFIKDQNIIKVPHIELLTSSLSENVKRVICNNNYI
ncbi:Hypothetical predicted protein [Octopus vulgaris]|uniref:VWFA domain-containing protein n=1 Tax=Octopus vulgaris TaxID=6645 RepID=A0AA36ATH7_OCTVU|nr:Hypothetical predicted protein [Octopus vulgaris]